MRTIAASLVVNWVGGASLALLYVLCVTYFTEGHIPFVKLWVMGIIPISLLLGSVAAIVLSPLTYSALIRNPARDAWIRGGALWCVLAFYLVLLAHGMVRFSRVDSYGLFTLFVPLLLASVGIYFAGRASR
jgi:hypothetical protein